MMREPIKDSPPIYFPCQEYRVCPYGVLVEDFPLGSNVEGSDEEKLVCEIFGHVCPYHYVAELI
jgi:hypothetical protein